MGLKRPARLLLAVTLGVMVLVTVAEARPEAQLPVRPDPDPPAAAPAPSCPTSCQRAPRAAVCGSDGVTYASRCHLALARCGGGGVTLRHNGACAPQTGVSVCLQKRAEALQGHTAKDPPQNIYVPQCEENGMYSEIQCHRGTGHCWCVNAQGVAVKGTAVRNARPECSARRARTSKRRHGSRRRGKGRRRRGCGSRAKTIFRDNAMRMIKREYERRRRHRAGSRTGDDLAKVAAEWKFSQMDRNHDGQVSRTEIRRLRKKARKVLEPTRCARRFHRYCDTDASRSLSQQEWLLCVGVNRDDKSRLGPASARSSTFEMLHGEEPSAEQSDEEEHSCTADRRQALDNQRLAEMEGKITTSFFIPSCTQDNKYSQVQCHNTTGYCWCADPDTGQSLQLGHVKDRLPDCSQVRLPPPGTQPARRGGRSRGKLPKACRERLTTFLHHLMDYLTNKMVKALQQGQYTLPSDPGGEKTFEAKVAEWKFGAIDKNQNDAVDRREWRQLRQELGSDEFSREAEKKRCGRRLPRYCDSNNDRKISRDEWLVCTGAIKEEKRAEKRPNPFEKYLISD